jgi:two-component system phosphate regulon sensor histidine kinase PhoR
LKVRHQLLFALVLTSLLTSVLVAVGAAELLRSTVRDRFVERVRAEVGALAWAFEETRRNDDLQPDAVALAARLGYRVTVIAEDGTVLADSSQSRAGVARMENHANRPEIRSARISGSGESMRRSATTGERYLYRAIRVDRGGGPAAIVRVAVPMAQLERTGIDFARIVVVVSLLVFGVLIGIAYGVVRRLSHRIETIAEIADRTAQGDLSLQAHDRGDDEIGRLASSLNRMKQNLVGNLHDIEDERKLLASIVSGIQEGLLLVGDDRRIRLANLAFRKIFQVPFDPNGRLLAEVIRFPAVIQSLEGILSGGPEIREMVIRSPETGRSFELHAAPLQPDRTKRERWALALFFDITRLEALENVRQEFVANVSHELRTPLTSIRAFVETLLEGAIDDAENRERFLEVIRKQAGHMEALIDDLTDLSRIETGAIQLELHPIDLGELARDVMNRVRQRYPESDVDLELDFPEPVRGRFDRRRMEQVLVNLVENAVKFNRPGGKVTVRGRIDENRFVLQVEDDGIGIPSESLPRIFNRFYRVDKARSKNDVPGTGLGLAIVKHLVRLHGGTIQVRSELGRGATFTLEFPAGPVELG